MKKLLFDSLSKDDLKEIILNSGKEKTVFNFLNLYSVYLFNKDEKFRESINKSRKNSIIIPDGFMVALRLGSKRLQGPVFTKFVLENKELSKGKKHFFLGLDTNQNEFKKILKKYPALKKEKLQYYNPIYIQENVFPKKEIDKILKLINKFEPDYLWICLGNPKQEILSSCIYENANANFIFNIGAAINYVFERKKESPEIIRKIGFEWLYRLITDFNHSKKKVIGSFIGLIYLYRKVGKKNEKSKI